MDELYELIVDAVAAYFTVDPTRVEIRLRRMRDTVADAHVWTVGMRLARATERNDDIKIAFHGSGSSAKDALRALAADVVDRLERGAKESAVLIERLRPHLPGE